MSDFIYLDHAATTPLDDEVFEAMLPFLKDEFGSASTLYSIGRKAKDAVEEARIHVARLINAKPNEIYFTSGGTEADNWAIYGVASAKGKGSGHIITSKIEHHAVLMPCNDLKQKNYDVDYLDVDENGFISLDDLQDHIRKDTILVSIMHANNEIGTIEPIEKIGKITREKGIHFHTDTVQTVGHIDVDVEAMNIDSLAISAHKLYGPKGVGAIYIKKGSKVDRFMRGGGQENHQRAGTHNVAGIVGFGKAAELAKERMKEEAEKTIILRDKLIEGVEKSIKRAKLNGDRVKRLPNNVNFSFFGAEGESITLLLDVNGICTSSGSACTSGSLDPSHVLRALGLSHEEAQGSLRMTLGKDNTEDHIEKVLSVLPGIINRLREMSPVYTEA
ncbi:MAG: cysteine desulfurase NifS [Armatimonadota bacterium]